MPVKKEQTRQAMFRLSDAHVAALDALAKERADVEHSPQSRTDALRWLINEYLRRTQDEPK